MSRLKKKRTGLMTILERKPSKKEFLEDPDSRESRKKKAMDAKKKPKSTFEKNRSSVKDKAEATARLVQVPNGRLAAKIKAQAKQKQKKQQSEES